jgi:glycosidase
MLRYGSDDWHYLPLSLPAGEYGYLVTDDDGTHPDLHNPQRTYRGDAEVSVAIVADCSVPELTVDSVDASDDGTVTIAATFRRAPGGGAGAAPDSIQAADAAGGALDLVESSAATGKLLLRGTGFSRGKHTFSLDVRDKAGRQASAPLAVAWVKPAARRWDEGILYQVVVDRFRGDGGAALSPPETPGRRAGGTLDGVRAAIESGYFDRLGVSALWLSPAYENPTGLFPGSGGHQYEAYHGYWPLASRGVEPKIGGEAALRALVGAAHARGIRVLFDFVPNHVFEKNERYLSHAKDGWFNDGPGACVCGTKGCDWGSHMQTCWFAPYLPDVRWQSAGALEATLGDLDFWMKTFDADGVRIDAVPMMARLATRRMALSLRNAYAPEGAALSIGEVYTGSGDGATDSIRYFLGPDGIGGAFDFPLSWTIRDVIAGGQGSFDDVEKSLLYSETTLAGSGAVLGRMLDNHDMPRFVSAASGDASADAWTSPAAVPDTPEPYAALESALALVMTLPGMPVLYYGDEVGLAGGSDPDNRRVLPAEGALSASQRHVLQTTRRLGALRACSAALRSGSRKAFSVEKTTYAFARIAGEEAALVMISTSAETAQIVPPLKAVPPGAYVDAFTLESFAVGSGAPVPMAPRSFRVLLPENSPCLSDSTPSQ